jgi:hypothetical protein
MGEIERRRRRLRPTSSAAPVPAPPPAGPPPVAPPVDSVTAAAEDPVRPVHPARPPRGRPTSGAGAGGDDREVERGLRGLVGSGSSQVSVGAALRARDAARPTDAQIADAEANLVIVHRNWMPREDLPRNR